MLASAEIGCSWIIHAYKNPIWSTVNRFPLILCCIGMSACIINTALTSCRRKRGSPFKAFSWYFVVNVSEFNALQL